MKFLSLITLILALLPPTLAVASGELENDLKSLDVQETVPSAVSKEKLYSIQSRNAPLKNHFEILASLGQNFTGDGFLARNQIGGEIQYHITDDWALGVGYNKVYNDFKGSADRLLQEQGVLPDVDYAKARIEGRVQYNLFYGKFRFTKDSVMYFDQYIAAGYAQNQLASGNANGPLGDAGFAFWISNWGSVHLGVKDYYYTEKAALTSGAHHNIHGYLQVGYLL